MKRGHDLFNTEQCMVLWHEVMTAVVFWHFMKFFNFDFLVLNIQKEMEKKEEKTPGLEPDTTVATVQCSAAHLCFLISLAYFDTYLFLHESNKNKRKKFYVSVVSCEMLPHNKNMKNQGPIVLRMIAKIFDL